MARWSETIGGYFLLGQLFCPICDILGREEPDFGPM
jgi:hypothetical protein